MRILRPSNYDELFEYCKKHNLFALDYSDKITWIKDIQKLLDSIPSFLKDIKNSNEFNQSRFKNLKLVHIKNLYKFIFMTKSSNHSFFYKTIKQNLPLRSLSLLHAIYINLFFLQNKKLPTRLKFLDLSFKIFEVNSIIIIMGPIDVKEDFFDEECKIKYISRLRSYFGIKQHTYDLINLLNQRESIELKEFDINANKFCMTFKYTSYFDSKKVYAKKRLRELAAYCIDLYKKGRKKSKDIGENSFNEYCKNGSFAKIISEIQTRTISREFESIEHFNNLAFGYADFDKYTENIMDFLKRKLQADTYIFNRYYQYNGEYQLQAQNDLDPKHKRNIEKTISRMNIDKEFRKSTISYRMVNGYYKDKKPINLIDDMDYLNIAQMLDNSPRVESALSIPLIFDNRIFAIIHFLGFSKYQFDEIDKSFLIKHATIISRYYIENIFDENLSHITKLLEGFEKDISNKKSLNRKIDRICEDITKIFSCDGVALWINNKEVFHTQQELDEVTLEAEINFLDKDEENNYSFDSNNKDCLFSIHEDKEIIVIDSIEDECSMDSEHYNYMPYKQAFIDKGIKSFIASPIKNYKGVLTGTLVIFDKWSREYDELTKSMTKRVSLHLGSILNTISSIKYQTQQNDERSLHESAQFLNMIDSRAKDLEKKLQKLYIASKHDKQNIFLNIEDIKDYAAYTKSFLFGIFQHGRFTRAYDEVIQKDINNIKRCKNYIHLKDIVNQVLAGNEKWMNLEKDIIYNNELELNIYVQLPKQELHNVISNIINNAIKYGKYGTYVKISENKNEQYYNIYIENIGYTIDNFERDRIFTKGYRGRVTKDELSNKKEFTETSFGNKGIGLYYAKSISRAWRGNIKLEKSEAIGQTNFAKNIFIIKIPIKIFKEKR